MESWRKTMLWYTPVGTDQTYSTVLAKMIAEIPTPADRAIVTDVQKTTKEDLLLVLYNGEF